MDGERGQPPKNWFRVQFVRENAAAGYKVGRRTEALAQPESVTGSSGREPVHQ